MMKISVIVPVYNSEAYLSKCLECIIAQTYKDLQIILVDDGSLDRSGAICDEYALADQRIHVIHKVNGGVSSARNVGLTAAAGEWIGFVDSDDWIEPDMFECLVENAMRHDADVAVCALWEELPQRVIPCGSNKKAVLNTKEALELLLRDDVMNNYLWNKLWRRGLFEHITFPEGRNFEDVAVVYKLFEQCSRIVCLPEKKYHYRQHQGSVLDDRSLKSKVDFYLASRQRMEELSTRWTQFDELLKASCVSSAIGIWASYYFNGRNERKKYLSILKEIAEFSKRNRFLVLKYQNLGCIGTFIALLTAYNQGWSFAFAGLCGNIYQLKHGRSI